MKRTRRTLALVALAATLSSGLAEAFPGFARKYSPSTSIFTFMPCSGCHDTFPKLTPFGRRFKESGFRVDGDTVSFFDAVKAAPVALRSSSFSSFSGDGSSTSGVLKGISAAGLGSHVSYWVDQAFYADGEGVRRLPINYAWAGAYDLLPEVRPGLLNVRAGSFELDLPFPQGKTHNLFAYDAYFLNGGDSDWSLATPQRGVELSGRPTDWGRFSLSLTDSVRRSTESRYDPDLYARFSADVGHVHRVGGFVYDGKDEITDALGSGPETVEHRRLGADLDLRYGGAGLNVYGLYLWGRDSGLGGKAIDTHGGFVQVEKLATPWLVLMGRYSQVNDGETRRNFSVGGFSWFLERLRLTFEYRFRDGSRDDEGLFSIDFVL